MKHKILIIDNDREFIAKAQLLLGEYNYSIFTIETYKEGFEAVKKIAPDIIILGLEMLKGRKRGDTLKSILQYAGINGIPAIIIFPDDGVEQLPEGIEMFIDKVPLKTIVLRKEIDEVLASNIKHLAEQAGEKHRQIISEVALFVEKWQDKPGNLIMILHEIQNEFGYVPRSVAFILSQKLQISLARIYEVITFYNFFRLEAPGKHIISVCLGTACYLKGAGKILEEIQSILNIEEGHTTHDGLFYLQVVRCLGCCGLAPVITIDDKVYGHMTRDNVVNILSKYAKKGELNNVKTHKR
jgi:NADH-quinone oxidoreductase subunit E